MALHYPYGGGRGSILSPALLALAAVTAALAFVAAMVLAGVLGAIDADLGGGLPTDAARESDSLTHGSGLLLRFGTFLGRYSGWTRTVLLFPAALCFPLHHRELLLILRRKVCNVLAQLIALGSVHTHGFR